jgi:hypothetical protein
MRRRERMKNPELTWTRARRVALRFYGCGHQTEWIDPLLQGKGAREKMPYAGTTGNT